MAAPSSEREPPTNAGESEEVEELRRALAEARAEAAELQEELDRARLAQLRLRVAGRTDSLTGLATRHHFLEQLDLTVAMAEESEITPAVLMIDVDRFKSINDTYGHEAGDDVLAAMGVWLRRVVGSDGLVARLGGDEFAVLVDDASFSQEIAHQIAAITQEPLVLGEVTVTVGVTIGIADWIPGDDHTSLMHHADLAMYQARQRRLPTRRFDPSARRSLDLHRTIAADLPAAIENNELELTLQPIVDLRTQMIRGFEVLSRWRHAELGRIRPDQFIEAAETTGQIAAVDRHVIARALDLARTALPTDDNDFRLSVNVSPLSLTQRFVSDVARLLETSPFPAEQLVFEITETSSIRDLHTVRDVLEQLAGLGLGLALDDFGTGYSSLTYVHDLPISELKIDRSFITDLLTDDRARELVRAIVQVGAALHLDVVAEGVESDRQAEMLRAMGCGYGQGWLFSRPVPAARAAELLSA